MGMVVSVRWWWTETVQCIAVVFQLARVEWVRVCGFQPLRAVACIWSSSPSSHVAWLGAPMQVRCMDSMRSGCVIGLLAAVGG